MLSSLIRIIKRPLNVVKREEEEQNHARVGHEGFSSVLADCLGAT